MLDENFVRRLEDEQANFAVEALKKPNLGNSFEYGYRCGIVLGLEVAKNKYIELLNEERGDRDV